MEYKPLHPESAIKMIQYIPQRPDYNTWTLVISAIANYYDYDIAYNILKSRFIDEHPNETEIKIKNRLQNIGIGTFIHIAKQNGYKAQNNVKGTFTSGYNSKGINNYIQALKPLQQTEKRVKLNLSDFKDNKPLYKAMEPLKEFHLQLANEYVKDGLTKLESISKVIESFDGIQKERAYYVSSNKHVLNKNLNPNTLQKYGYLDTKTNEFKESYIELNNNFKSYIVTLNEMIQLITKGYPLIFCRLNKQTDGTYKRTSENFVKSNCFAIDIDGGLSLQSALSKNETKKALLIYTSPSHKESENRYRIIFPLPVTFEKDKSIHLKEIIKHYIDVYNADKQCNDLTRIFYGNNNAIVYNIRTGEIHQYKDGGLL